MTFTYPGEDISKIIKSFSCDGYSYEITYLDGSVSQYTSYNEEEKKRIIEIMINQAIDRQENIDEKFFKSSVYNNSILSFLSMILCSMSLINRNIIGTIVFALKSFFEIGFALNANKKVNELKKYKLFLEMINDLDEINKSSILKCVEFENIYQKNLDITTVDEYSYGDIKKIYKKYKEK